MCFDSDISLNAFDDVMGWLKRLKIDYIDTYLKLRLKLRGKSRLGLNIFMLQLTVGCKY